MPEAQCAWMPSPTRIFFTSSMLQIPLPWTPWQPAGSVGPDDSMSWRTIMTLT
jgi:hypothetical protein